MSQIGARTPINSALGYQEIYGGTASGWQRLGDILTIPPEATGALIYALDYPGTAVHWAQSPNAVLGSFANGLVLAPGQVLVLEDATQVQGFCVYSDLVPAITVQFFTGPRGRLPSVSSAGGSGGGGGGGVQSVNGTDVDNSDPVNPVVMNVTIPTQKAIWVVSIGAMIRYPSATNDLATPYQDLQTALDAATGDDTVVVMPGAVNDEIRSIAITGKKNIHLMGTRQDTAWDGLSITVDDGAELLLTGFGQIQAIFNNGGSIRSYGPNVAVLYQTKGNIYIVGDMLNGAISVLQGTAYVRGTVKVQRSAPSYLGIITYGGTTLQIDGELHQLHDDTDCSFSGAFIHNGTMYLKNNNFMEFQGKGHRIGSVRCESVGLHALRLVDAELEISGPVMKCKTGVEPIYAYGTCSLQLNGGCSIDSDAAAYVKLNSGGLLNVRSFGAYVKKDNPDPAITVDGHLNIAPWM